MRIIKVWIDLDLSLETVSSVCPNFPKLAELSETADLKV